MASLKEQPGLKIELVPLFKYISDSRAQVKDVQRIGRAAWLAQLDERSVSEIEHVYNPKDPRLVADQAKLIATIKKGEYIGAIVSTSGSIQRPKLAGFAAIKQDVSGNVAERFVKTKMLRRSPYATVPTINVLPEYQRSGVGTSLMWGLSVSKNVAEHMAPTAYVLEENPSAMSFFGTLGFQKIPEDQQPVPQTDYFGPDTAPAEMWRLQASSVIAMQTKILESMERKQAYIVNGGTYHRLSIRTDPPS